MAVGADSFDADSWRFQPAVAGRERREWL